MSTRKLVCLAVIAGLGLSACSYNPRTTSARDTVTAKTNATLTPGVGALNLAQTNTVGLPVINRPAPVQIAKALDLNYGSNSGNVSHSRTLPQAQPIRAAALPRAGHSIIPQRPASRTAMVSYSHARTVRGQQSTVPSLSRVELRAIGQQIFVNEGGGNMQRLVHWNVGEDFAAMGIGHFTWYPAGRRQRFGNTFPGLLDYMSSRGVQLPAWLRQARHSGSPWRSRNDFLRQRNSPQVRELQALLYNTRDIQAEYIVNRARRAMPKLVKASSSHLQQRVAQNLNAVANTPGGWYALIDYVNFKGEGLGNGGYRGQSWGLRQVLEEMRPSQPGQRALHEFADAAMRVLQRRVRNSDPRRNEARWLRGWSNRVNTYRRPIV